MTSILEWIESVFVSDLGLKKEILGNTIEQYLIALGIFIGLSLLFFVIQKITIRRFKKVAQRTETDIDDALIEVVRSIRPPFYYFIAFFIAIQFISLFAIASKIVETILILWAVYQIIGSIQILFRLLIEKKMEKTENENTKAALNYMVSIGKWILWAIGLLLALSNLGVNVTSLVAGLGIGGAAIAFALQNILKDLFSSFVVFFDKPFEVGDFIESDNHYGTVTQVGIKTTRLQSLEGPELIISNNDVTSSRIKNYGRVEQWRAVTNFGVAYETSAELLNEIPNIMKEIVEEGEKNTFDRADFTDFGTFTLNFEVSFYVQTDDYNEYMAAKGRVNSEIKRRLEGKGVVFAYPARTIYTAVDEKQ